MRPTASLLRLLLIAAFTVMTAGACDERATSDGKPATADRGGIASLSPALTSILLGLGGGDTLVAVSHYDTDPRVADLPRVGDYLNVDWEKLAELRPNVIVTQRDDAALAERALDMNIVTVAAPITRLDDVWAAVQVMAVQVIDEPDAANSWRRRLDALQADGEIRTLLVCGDRSLCAGRGNYVDDLLTRVGGTNVLTADGYLEPDAEQVAELAPDVILVLLPDGDEAEVRARWERFGRVEILQRPDALLPGWNLPEIGEQMQQLLKPRAERSDAPDPTGNQTSDVSP